MNESAVRRRLREAFGESNYPPDLTGRIAARISRPEELSRRSSWVLAAVAAVLAIALVATLLLGAHALRGRAVVPVKRPFVQGPAAASCQSSNAVDQSVVKMVTMFTPSTGWAAGGLRTTDGGAHWHSTLPESITSASPAQGAYAREFSEFYLDADHGWALRTYATSRACLDHADVWSTLDGGATWSKVGTFSFALPPDYAPSDYAPASLELTFVDDRHGWLWATVGSVNGPYVGFSGIAQSDAQLFATVDGGASWRLVSTVTRAQIGLPQPNICTGAFSDLHFSDVTTAWMGVQCLTSGGALLVTHDGGATWKIETAPDPCDCFPHPRFFDARHGVVELYSMAVYYGPAALLSTSDGGRTWQALPAIPEPGYSMGIAYVDANHWWDLVTQPSFGKKGDPTQDWLYRTDDGGQTWTLVQTGLPLGWPVDQIQFFDLTHGWAIQPANNTRGLPPELGTDEILVTSDGGRTWTVTATGTAAK